MTETVLPEEVQLSCCVVQLQGDMSLSTKSFDFQDARLVRLDDCGLKPCSLSSVSSLKSSWREECKQKKRCPGVKRTKLSGNEAADVDAVDSGAAAAPSLKRCCGWRCRCNVAAGDAMVALVLLQLLLLLLCLALPLSTVVGQLCP